MKIFRKVGNVFEVLIYPYEEIRKGEYLLIEDSEKDLSIVVQVIDINYIDSPGILDELVREGIMRSSVFYENDIGGIGRATKFIRDSKIATTVIRGAIRGGSFSSLCTDIPSRAFSEVRRISTSEVVSLIRGSNGIKYPVVIGSDFNGNEFIIDADKLDGSLSLITGMKGSGKSHLSKLLVEYLVNYGAPVIVFDLNGEYRGLNRVGLIKVLEPGKNIFFSLNYLGRDSVLKLLTNVLGLPGVSANLFNEIWSIAERSGRSITVDFLINVVNNFVKNLMIRDALVSRLMILRSTRFISDDEEKIVRIEDFFRKELGYIIILKGLSSVERRLLVELFLSKLTDLLERHVIPPLFMFAEEAHMYIRDTYWEDLITRMRHFGLFVVYITNQPDSLGHQIFRQLDNIFIFRFQNDHDLDMMAKISNIDSDTVKSLARDLSRGRVLIIGPVVEWVPSVIDIRSLNFDSMGMTRKIFN